MDFPRPRSGFTLVELSIVLVILGLLIGGVLTGQSLIRAAELRSISTDFQRYQTAVYTFRDKYLAIPGDMTNATKYWGSVTDSGQTCPNGLGTGTQTCDGDGDGAIFSSTGVFYEAARAWQQLANAGLIEGSYTGIQNGGSPYFTLGVNAPASKIRNAGYTLIAFCPSSFADSNLNTGIGQCWGPQSIARVGLLYGAISDATRAPTVLKPEEAFNLDTKMDDGKPDQGRIQSGSSANSCYSPSTSPATYTLTNTAKVCNLSAILIQ